MADPGISKPGARSRSGRILRSVVRFDAPSLIPFVFAVRVLNKIHDVNIVCYYNHSICMLYSQNLPKNFKPGGRAPGAPVLDPPLD